MDGPRLGQSAVADAGPAQGLQAATAHRRWLDPLETKQAEKKAAAKVPTFAECAEAYVEAHRAGWRNPKHVAQWESTLKTYAAPIIGGTTAFPEKAGDDPDEGANEGALQQCRPMLNHGNNAVDR